MLASPASCLDTFFPVPPELSAVRPTWSNWQYITLVLLLLKISKKCLVIFVHRLLVHLPNRNTDFSSISSRSCNSVVPIFTSSLLSEYLSISLAKFVLEGSTSPSPVFHQDPMTFFFSGCCGNGVFRVLSGRGGALAIAPSYSMSCHSFCPLSCRAPFFP